MSLPAKRPDTRQSYKPIGRRKLRAGQIWRCKGDTLPQCLPRTSGQPLSGIFGVKQRTPANLDTAIAATLKLEFYLSQKAALSSVKEEESTDYGQIGAVSVSNHKLVTLGRS